MSLPYEIIKNEEMGWGALYMPKNPKDIRKEGLRVILFVSCDCGNLMIRDLSRFETLYPEKLNIVAVITDDPVDPAARISLHKRIWGQFEPEERRQMFQRVIASSISHGVPCYSGAVKTDYFRKLYHEWDPEALLMFCFGQKLDAAVYEYPALGAYNFHPSDLPKKQGAGTQPFQNAIRNGLKSSPLVIHGVTELIDMGPIIGVSPQVNICLSDGRYPSSIITLLDKITSIGGWMGVALADRLIRHKESGGSGTPGSIDFEKIMPPELKARLSEPAVDDLNEKYTVSLHPLLQ